MEFFPIEELKFTETKNGEEYITKLAKAACVGIFNETRENVNDHAQEKIDEMESTLLLRVQDLQKQLIKIRVNSDLIPDLKSDSAHCMLQLEDKATKNMLDSLAKNL